MGRLLICDICKSTLEIEYSDKKPEGWVSMRLEIKYSYDHKESPWKVDTCSECEHKITSKSKDEIVRLIAG